MTSQGRRTQERAALRSSRGRTAMTVPAAVPAEPITGHVFRLYQGGGTGEHGGVITGMCGYLGTCNRPRADHEERTTAPSPCCEFHDANGEPCAPDDQGGYCCDNCPALVGEP